MTYYVVEGDTLDGIAEKFGIPISSLIAQNNNIDPNHLFAGQVLQVGNMQDITPNATFSHLTSNSGLVTEPGAWVGRNINYKPTILIRNTIAIIFLLTGAYLSISAIIALPLLEEEANYQKEDLYALNEQIDRQRDQTIIYLNDINVDSTTRRKYDSISVLLGNHNKSETIAARYTMAKQNIIENIKDQAYQCKLLYLNTGVMSKIKKDDFASQLLLNYSSLCMETKQQVFVKCQALVIQTSALFAIALTDKSPGYKYTREQKVLFSNLFSGFAPINIEEPPKKRESGTGYFIAAGWALKERSQNLAIITGLIGFALFGAVLGAFSKQSFHNVKTDHKRTDGLIYYEIVVVLVRGFSAALVVYLSLKGGLSLITTTSSDKINPYVILFLCFISAVFSDNIWEWAKTKLVGGDPSGSVNNRKGNLEQNPNGKGRNPDPNNINFTETGAEIPAQHSITLDNGSTKHT